MMKITIKIKILLIAVIGVLGFSVFFANTFIVSRDNSVRLSNVKDVYFPILEKTDANMVRLDKIKEQLQAAVASAELDMVDESKELANVIYASFDEIKTLAPSEVSSIEMLNNMFSDYFVAAEKLSRAMIGGKISPDAMADEISGMQKKLELFQFELKKYRSDSYETFTSNINDADAAADRTIILGFVVGGIAIVLLVVSAVFISSLIGKNVIDVVKSLRDMAAGGGDLTNRLKVKSNDEIGDLVKAFNDFVANLQSIMIEVRDVTHGVSVSSSSLSVIADVNKQSSSQQLSETDQVATAVHEMSAAVLEVAKHTRMASDAAAEANSISMEGGEVVARTVETIDNLAAEVNSSAQVIQELETDSERIGSVLDVIKDIAEQTNLLALNAAIEAARAGEQGRGFAVVADEVRSLASRTQKSTTEIQEMIEQLQARARKAVSAMHTSSERAKESVEQASHTGGSLQKISAAVGRMNDMNVQIASAAEQQSAVAENINKTVSKITRLAHDTSGGAEETAKASTNLNTTSLQLQDIVDRFKL